MEYGRVHWFLPEELDAAQRDYYRRLTGGPRDAKSITDEQGRLYGAFNARLLDPPVGTAIQELGAALRFGTDLSPREREIVILEVARAERADYEWVAHAKVARRIGMTDDEIEALRTGAPAATFTTAERLARTTTQTLLTARDLDDTQFAAVRHELGLVKLFDIVSLVGHYQHTALATRVWRVPPRDGAPVAFD